MYIDDSFEFERDYHLVIARLLAHLNSLPYGTPCWTVSAGLTTTDLVGIDRGSLHEIVARLKRDGLIGSGKSEKYDVEGKDASVEEFLGFDPKTVGISDRVVYPLVVKLSDEFDMLADAKLREWENEAQRIRKESNKKIAISYSGSSGLTRPEGTVTLAYPLEFQSKRYYILCVLNDAKAPLTREELHDLLPVDKKGSVQQLSKDIKALNRLMMRDLRLSTPVIVNRPARRGYCIDKKHFIILGINSGS